MRKHILLAGVWLNVGVVLDVVAFCSAMNLRLYILQVIAVLHIFLTACMYGFIRGGE